MSEQLTSILDLYNKHYLDLTQKASLDTASFAAAFDLILSQAIKLSNDSPDYESSYKLLFKMVDLEILYHGMALKVPSKRDITEGLLIYPVLAKHYGKNASFDRFVKEDMMKTFDDMMNSIELYNLFFVCSCLNMLLFCFDEFDVATLHRDYFGNLFRKRICIFTLKIVAVLKTLTRGVFWYGLRDLIKFLSKGLKFGYFGKSEDFVGNLKDLCCKTMDLICCSDLDGLVKYSFGYLVDILGSLNIVPLDNFTFFVVIIKIMNDKILSDEGLADKAVRIVNKGKIKLDRSRIESVWFEGRNFNNVDSTKLFSDQAISIILNFSLKSSLSYKLILKLATRIPGCVHSISVFNQTCDYFLKTNLFPEFFNQQELRKRMVSFIYKRINGNELLSDFFFRFETDLVKSFRLIKDEKECLRLLHHFRESFVCYRSLLLKYDFKKIFLDSFNESTDCQKFLQITLCFKVVKEFTLNENDIEAVYVKILCIYRSQLIEELQNLESGKVDPLVLFNEKFLDMVNVFKELPEALSEKFIKERTFLGFPLPPYFNLVDTAQAFMLLLQDNLILHPITLSRVKFSAPETFKETKSSICMTSMNIKDFRCLFFDLYRNTCAREFNAKLVLSKLAYQKFKFNYASDHQIIKVCVKDQVYTIKKLLLASSSEVFNRMLYGQFKEGSSSSIFLDENSVPVCLFVKFLSLNETGQDFDVESLFLLLFFNDKLTDVLFSVLLPCLSFADKYLLSEFKTVVVYGLYYVATAEGLKLFSEIKYELLQRLYNELLVFEDERLDELKNDLKLCLFRIIVSMAYKMNLEEDIRLDVIMDRLGLSYEQLSEMLQI